MRRLLCALLFCAATSLEARVIRLNVYPVTFTDNKAIPVEGEQARRVFQESADRLHEFSYGRDTFIVQVASTYALNIPTPGQCGYESWNEQVVNGERMAGFPDRSTQADIEYEVFVHPTIPCASHVGSAYADCNGGADKIWFNGQLSPETIAHELIHLVYHLCPHSAALFKGLAGVSRDGLSPGDTPRERGGRWSTMGGSRGWPYFDELVKMGSLSAGQRVYVPRTATVPEDFRLDPIEMPGGVIYVVSISRADGPLYTVEHREPIGLDALLTRVPQYPVLVTWGGYNCYLGDLSPGQKFVDAQGGVSIEVHADGTVRVTNLPVAAPTPGPPVVPTRVPTYNAGGTVRPTPCYQGGIIPCQTPTPRPPASTSTPRSTSSPAPTTTAAPRPTVDSAPPPGASPTPSRSAPSPTVTSPPATATPTPTVSTTSAAGSPSTTPASTTPLKVATGLVAIALLWKRLVAAIKRLFHREPK